MNADFAPQFSREALHDRHPQVTAKYRCGVLYVARLWPRTLSLSNYAMEVVAPPCIPFHRTTDWRSVAPSLTGQDDSISRNNHSGRSRTWKRQLLQIARAEQVGIATSAD